MSYLDLCLELTPEQQDIKNTVRRFAREVLRPVSLHLDRLADPAAAIRADSPYWDVMRQMKQLGYHTVLLPEVYGGMGLSPLELHLFFEEVGWGSAGLAVSIGVDCFPAMMACFVGEEPLIQEFVVPFVESKDGSFIGCWAITEPDHGSDQLVVGTPYFHDPTIRGQVVLRRDGDEWVIEGQKAAWISNGPVATHALLFANVEPSRGMAGGGIAIVPLDLPGVTRGRPLDKIGQRELPQSEIYFDGVRIPDRYLLVGPDTYEAMLDQVLAIANAGMGAVFTGVARAAFEEALSYTKQRRQGGRLLCEHQLVQKRLFDMFVRVETARALSRAAMIYNFSTAPPVSRYSIAAKVYCTQVAFEVAHEAVQLFGGYGLSREYLVEKLFRDARAALIEDGSNDVLALAGAHALLREYELPG